MAGRVFPLSSFLPFDSILRLLFWPPSSSSHGRMIPKRWACVDVKKKKKKVWSGNFLCHLMRGRSIKWMHLDKSVLHVILGICALDWNIFLTPRMNVTEGCVSPLVFICAEALARL